jgi:hypothetical protein
LLPPKAGVGFVQVLVVVPPPQVALHGLHADQSPFTGQFCVLQSLLNDPEQAAPPKAGAGLVQVRVWVPPPQVALQTLQSDQPPAIGVGSVMATERFAAPLEPLNVAVIWV